MGGGGGGGGGGVRLAPVVTHLVVFVSRLVLGPTL